MKWLLLCVLVLAGCHHKPPVVDVDTLNAVEQARLQAQADREQEKDKSMERVIKDLRRENLEKMRKLK